MSNPKDNESLVDRWRQTLPFFVEFVKFSAAFSAIIAVALLALQTVSAATL